jgi:LysM repeat protein
VIEAPDGAHGPGERQEERPERLGPWSPAPPASGSHCPFLASIDLDDRVGQPRLTPDTANRCFSTGEPVAASARDQRELCLTADHTACARLVPATHSSGEPEVGPARGRRLSGPILAAVAVLILAAALAGISLAANGDLSVGLGGASPSPSTTASAPAAATTAPASAPAAAATLIPAVAPAPTDLPTTTPVPTAAVAAATSAPPTPTPTPKPKKYRGLTPCPGVVDCYVYVVKSGDALGAIADRYGLGLDEVLARNPSIRDPALIVRGQKIRLPTPKN